MVRYPESDSCQLACLGDLLEQHIGYKTDGRFVEVGAFDGYNWSNTWGLAKVGWKGLYVEANPEYCGKCRQMHASNNVTVECVACGPYPGRAKLYLGGSVSTILAETVDIYRTIPTLAFTGLDRGKYIEVDVLTLDAILDKHGWQPLFDVLVVDVEGAEYDVLRGFHLRRWMPKMAIIEVHEDFRPELAWKAIPVEGYFKMCGYSKVHHDQINSVYVR